MLLDIVKFDRQRMSSRVNIEIPFLNEEIFNLKTNKNSNILSERVFQL